MELIADSDYVDLVVDDADCAGLDLSGSSFVGCTFRRGSFANAVLRATRFERCSFIGTDLSNVDLCDAEVTRTIVVRCDLSGAQFGQASTRALDIRGSVLSGSVSLTQARGFVIGSEQVLALAVGVLSQVGARIDDDPPPDPSDLPGGSEVRGAEPTDPARALRGIQAARAQLRIQ